MYKDLSWGFVSGFLELATLQKSYLGQAETQGNGWSCFHWRRQPEIEPGRKMDSLHAEEHEEEDQRAPRGEQGRQKEGGLRGGSQVEGSAL